MAQLTALELETLAKERPSGLFAEAVEDLFQKPDKVEWICHTHDRMELSDSITLVHGSKAYEPVGRNGIYISDDDVVSLGVPLGARNAILGNKKVSSSIDEYIKRAVAFLNPQAKPSPFLPLLPERGEFPPYQISVAYIIPNPELFERVTLRSLATNVIVSVVLPEQYLHDGATLAAAKASGEVRVQPELLATELSAISKTLLTYKGLNDYPCWGEATGPGHHKLNAYIQGYMAPRLRILSHTSEVGLTTHNF